MVKDREFWRAEVNGITKSDMTEQLNIINTEMETGLWSQRNYKEANNTTWSQCVRYQMSDESKVLYGLKEE